MRYSFSGSESAEEPKIGFYEYLFVLMMILYAGRSLMFFESPDFGKNPVGVVLPFLFSIILAFKWRIVFTVEFYVLLLFFTLYFLAISIKYYVIHPSFLVTYFLLFFTTYTAVKALKFNIFIIYEKILYILAIISLVLWGFQVLAGGDALFNIISGYFSFMEPISFVSGKGISTVVYAIQPYATTLINNFTTSRNCGFAWEPGSYASYLCLGIYINLFSREQDKNSRKRFWVFLAALLSTLSTTGYVILSIIMIYYLMNKEFRNIVLLIPVVIIALILFFSLPFMKDKILELVKEPASIQNMVWDSYGRETATTPQRFSSLLITLIDFKNNPILGIAAHGEESWVRQVGSNISPISGIGNLLAQFGLAGTIPFIIYTIKSSFVFSRYYRYRGKFLLFFIIFGISISYSILFIPFVMCFWMFALFEPDPETISEINEKSEMVYEPEAAEDRS
jgi:hypothetical protein